MMEHAFWRRVKLATWIHERPAHSGLTATEIVDVSGIYRGHGRYDRCFDDLKVLERSGGIEREPGRPARWKVA
jgi:sugar-specific transcriptional regulator TrmB